MNYNKINYNNKLVKYLKEIYEYLEKNDDISEIKAYKYDWEKEEKKKIVLNGYVEDDNKWINYYWIEFIKDGEEYKFSLFYKDFDIGSGNVHVLPGAIQLWKKMDKTDNKLENRIEDKGKGSVTYSEDEWDPIFAPDQIHYISDEKDLNTVLKKIITEDLIKEKSKDIIKKQLLGSISDEVKFYTFDDKIEMIRKKSFKEAKYFINNTKYKYYAIKWFQISKYYWISFYFSELDKNGLIFPKFGQIQFWRGINKENKNGKSPNEYINGKWKFYYPNKGSMDDNIKGISTWQINNNKNKLCNFIELIKRNQKSFNPDINLQEDTSILEDEFNEFVKLCSIIENNKNESTENILKTILGE